MKYIWLPSIVVGYMVLLVNFPIVALYIIAAALVLVLLCVLGIIGAMMWEGK